MLSISSKRLVMGDESFVSSLIGKQITDKRLDSRVAEKTIRVHEILAEASHVIASFANGQSSSSDRLPNCLK